MEESLMKKFFKNPFVLTVIAIILGFVVAGLILLLAGFPPVESIRTLIESMIGRPKDISSVVIRSTPIIFTGLGVAFAIKTGLFNIGAEGQYIIGCVVATMVGSMLDFPKPVAILMVMLSAMLASALYAGFVGLLKSCSTGSPSICPTGSAGWNFSTSPGRSGCIRSMTAPIP